jgi:hypothetical protein
MGELLTRTLSLPRVLQQLQQVQQRKTAVELRGQA